MKRNNQVSESNRHIIDDEAGASFPLYQLWKGSNIFILKGRVIFGPDVKSLIITILLILAPVILFCGFVSRRLVGEFHHKKGSAIVGICLVFTLYVIGLLFLTSGRDPGIVPRNQQPPDPEEAPATKEVVVNGHVVQVKYCKTCQLYRPPRCSHCSICDNCVERFDHHCPWVGQCIGQRNYRFFFMFISSTTLLCLYVFGFCWVNIHYIMRSYRCSLWRAFLDSPVSALLILYTFVMCWFVGGLTVFHVFLICTNQTTYENFRYSYHGKINPYDRGCACNFVDIFFSRIPTSKNHFRAKVQRSPSTAVFDSPLVIAKRQTVAAQELEDIQTQIHSIRRMERCATEPTHAHPTTWAEITRHMNVLASEFDSTRRHKIHGPL